MGRKEKLMFANRVTAKKQKSTNILCVDPRRVCWGGSGRHFATPLWLDPADPADPAVCAKLVFRVRETLLLTPEAEFVCV